MMAEVREKMPFININTNVSVSKEQEVAVKTRLGKAIELIPGKSESWLMVGFEGEHPLYFRGSDSERIASLPFSRATSNMRKRRSGAGTEAIFSALRQMNPPSDSFYHFTLNLRNYPLCPINTESF